MSGRHARVGAWRRGVPLALVAGLLALAGVANATLRVPAPPPAPVVSPPDAALSPSPAVDSVAWYCPGPLEIGAGAPAAGVVLSNVGPRPRHGVLIVDSTSGPVEQVAVAVAPGSTRTFTLPESGARRLAAATVVVDGGGVGVAQVTAANPRTAGRAPLSTPCRDRTAAAAYLAAGGSHNADHVLLALYDPSATPAVANVTLATSSGPAAPPSFQGVAVGAGQLVVLDVSRAVPGRPMVATAVHATGGRLVVGALLSAARGHGVQSALVVASPTLQRSWDFAPVPSGPGTAEAIAVFNPGNRPASVELTTSGSGGPAQVSATVPAGGVSALATGSVKAIGAVRAARLSVRRGPAVAALRELVLEQPLPAERAAERVKTVTTLRVHGRLVRRIGVAVHIVAGGSAAPRLLPALPPGFSVSAGVSRPATAFLLPYGRADATTGEVIALWNPAAAPAEVRLRLLSPGTPVALRLPAPLSVPAGGVLSLALDGLVTPPGPVALVVSASTPVVAGALLDALGTKAVGLSSAGALSLGG